MDEVRVSQTLILANSVTGVELVKAVVGAAGGMFYQESVDEHGGSRIGQESEHTYLHIRVWANGTDIVVPWGNYSVITIQSQQWDGAYTLLGYGHQAYVSAVEEFTQKLKAELAQVESKSPKMDVDLVRQMLLDGKEEELLAMTAGLLGLSTEPLEYIISLALESLTEDEARAVFLALSLGGLHQDTLGYEKVKPLLKPNGEMHTAAQEVFSALYLERYPPK